MPYLCLESGDRHYFEGDVRVSIATDQIVITAMLTGSNLRVKEKIRPDARITCIQSSRQEARPIIIGQNREISYDLPLIIPIILVLATIVM